MPSYTPRLAVHHAKPSWPVGYLPIGYLGLPCYGSAGLPLVKMDAAYPALLRDGQWITIGKVDSPYLTPLVKRSETMWTVVQLRTHVPEGFDDSGWAPTKLYITGIVVKDQVMPIVNRYFRQTEVDKIKLVGFNYLDPLGLKLGWMVHKCDIHGKYVEA